jgi:membrane-bound serine protease (ClpP class)
MSSRLILAITSVLVEETALAVIILVGLPGLDINIPVIGLIAIMIAWLAISALIYRAGSRALKRKPLTGLETMVGTRGKSLGPLDPDGLVSIGGEYWQARAASGKIAAGDKVTVVSQKGSKLTVRSVN